MTKTQSFLLYGYSIAVYIFLLLPLVIVVIASFTPGGYVSFPPQGVSLRWYQKILDHPEFLDSFVTSIVVAFITTILSTVVGVSGALAIVRYRFPGRDFLNAFFLSPLMLPTLVIGVALLIFYARMGLPRTFLTIVPGHIIITVPYVVRIVSASLAGFDRSLELAARNLGASAFDAFLRITFPIVLPGILAGSAFAFIVSFDDVNVALFLSTTATVTLPVRIFTYLELQTDPMITAVTSALVIMAFVMVVVIERSIGVGKMFGTEKA